MNNDIELEELKAKLYYLEREYMSRYDSWSVQENLYFLTDIQLLKNKINKLKRRCKNGKRK